LLDFTTGSGNGNELTLWRRLWNLLRPGDIVLGDSKYCSYADLALLCQRGLDVVARLGIRKSDFRVGRMLGIEDHVTCWYAPQKFPAWLGSQVLAPYMPVRELRFKVEVPGFRVHIVTLVTTLLDAEVYPKEDLADLFFSRWQVEAFHSHYTSSSKDLFSDAWAPLGLLSRQGQVAATAAAMAA